jgi:hypothetical protein
VDSCWVPSNDGVRHELGEGGAPPAVAKHMAALNNEYEIASKTLMAMGFNGAMLDCELPKVKNKPVFHDNEVQIQHIVDNKQGRGVVQDWSDCCKLQSCCGGGEGTGRARKEGKGKCRMEEGNQIE